VIIAGKYEVPDRCPENCPDYGRPFDMCSPCFRCPILNCSTVLDEDGNDMTPLAPEDFHQDLAKEWYEFFKELKDDRRKTPTGDTEL
jgi:hypothetical protein